MSEMDALYKNLVRVGSKERIPFKCIGCGECCKHVNQQVPLEALDAYRMARYLRDQGEDIQDINDFLVRYAEPALLAECGYFVYFLKVQGPDDSCIFLQDNRCRVHAVNPRACRTYPFIAEPDDKGGFNTLISFERKQHFKGAKVHPKTWMKTRFTDEDRAFLNMDLGSAKEISRLLRLIPEKDKAVALLYFQGAKYGGFDLDEPFLPQYKKNIKRLLVSLKRLAERNNTDEDKE